MTRVRIAPPAGTPEPGRYGRLGVGFYVLLHCRDCGAIVHRKNEGVHDAFHDRLEALERAARRQ